jgi:hypothetical protein
MSVAPNRATALIVTYNSAELVTRYLDSLPKALSGVKHVIAVVDNVRLDRGTRPSQRCLRAFHPDGSQCRPRQSHQHGAVAAR